MGNTDNKKRKQGKIARFTAPEAVKHFAPGRKIPSDVLGSYTGTPLDTNGITDNPDYFPVQDADDL